MGVVATPTMLHDPAGRRTFPEAKGNCRQPKRWYCPGQVNLLACTGRSPGPKWGIETVAEQDVKAPGIPAKALRSTATFEVQYELFAEGEDTMGILKRSKEEIVFEPIGHGPFSGSTIAEVFDTSGGTAMSCGIHEIPASVTIVERAPVDDVLYILEGEMEVESDGISKTYRAGDFAYLLAGERQQYTVRDRVKHVYVCYPGNWKEGK